MLVARGLGPVLRNLPYASAAPYNPDSCTCLRYSGSDAVASGSKDAKSGKRV